MITVKNLVKTFNAAGGRVNAVDDFSFEVPAGSFCTLLGPSGCGKSTTLRSIAGLERPNGGEIHIGDRCVYSERDGTYVSANKRAIGMVFQSYAIWPHMTVFDNVAYALKASKRSRKGESNQKTTRARVLHALELVGLGGLEDRPAPLLSGGQQQRVALARAVVAEPNVLLLDEPLSNLDAALRTHMRIELKNLQSELGITTLYVTHDQHEALAMSDNVIVMSDGQALQQGPPHEIYHHPSNRETAEFIGSINLLSCRLPSNSIAEVDNVVQTDFGELHVDGKHHAGRTPPARMSVCIRPEAVFIEPTTETTPVENSFTGVIERATFLGQHVDYVVRVGEAMLRVQTPSTKHFAAGTAVTLRLPRDFCTLLLEGVEKNPALEAPKIDEEPKTSSPADTGLANHL